MVAAGAGHIDLIDRLLDAGARIDAKDRRRGFTPLMSAVWTNQELAVTTLLDRGAPIDQTNDKGHTALFWAANRGWDQLVPLLIERGADVNSASNNGVTPLIIAAAAGHTATVDALLKAGADPTLKDAKGKTALEWAQQRKKQKAAELLQAATAD